MKYGIVGFTGSRDEGMPTFGQIVKVDGLLFALRPYEVHHGDCIGSDHWFHLRVTGPYKYRPCVHVHPPDNPRYRANCIEGMNCVIHPTKPYMKRNQDIVDASDVLIATPHGPEEVRSGTWATIRRARKKGIPIYIVYPSGTVIKEN